VSNNPSSRVVMRIQPAAVVFLVMVLMIGALLLASSNIDPRAMQRAQFSPTPVDVFLFKAYKPWQSTNNLVQLEYPDTWQAQPDPQGNPFSYYFVPPGNATGLINVALYPLSQPVTPQAAIQQLASSQAQNQPAPAIKPVTIAGLQGMTAHQQIVSNDQAGQSVPFDQDWVALALDDTHLLVIRTVSQTQDWPKMQPIIEHVINTLKVDVTGAVKELNAAVATPQATAPATQAATQAAPQAATPAAVGTESC
jgi:hypothetical protein